MYPPDAGNRGNRVETTSLAPQDFPDRLPPSLVQFVRPSDIQLPGMPKSFTLLAHHGGSHPFLVDEFVGSIVEKRSPLVDARRSASWTAPGICAHQSALNGGAEVEVPEYSSFA